MGREDSRSSCSVSASRSRGGPLLAELSAESGPRAGQLVSNSAADVSVAIARRARSVRAGAVRRARAGSVMSAARQSGLSMALPAMEPGEAAWYKTRQGREYGGRAADT